MATRDDVDFILEQWRRQRPELDPVADGIVGRVSRLARELETGSSRSPEHGPEGGWHDVLATLRHQGLPFRMRRPI